jgi:hypothetical protein
LGNTDRFARACAAVLGLGCVALAPIARASCVDPATLKPAHGSFDFRQTRYLKHMSAPLVSEGVALLSPGRVEWRVDKPVAIVTVITANHVTQSIEGGPAQPIGGSGNVDPLMRSLGLLQIVSGDFASARENYDLVSSANGAGPGWRLTLTPKDAQAARFLSRIEITGCERPAEVDIFQVNGDHTRIEWSIHR